MVNRCESVRVSARHVFGKWHRLIYSLQGRPGFAEEPPPRLGDTDSLLASQVCRLIGVKFVTLAFMACRVFPPWVLGGKIPKEGRDE